MSPRGYTVKTVENLCPEPDFAVFYNRCSFRYNDVDDYPKMGV